MFEGFGPVLHLWLHTCYFWNFKPAILLSIFSSIAERSRSRRASRLHPAQPQCKLLPHWPLLKRWDSSQALPHKDIKSPFYSLTQNTPDFKSSKGSCTELEFSHATSFFKFLPSIQPCFIFANFWVYLSRSSARKGALHPKQQHSSDSKGATSELLITLTLPKGLKLLISISQRQHRLKEQPANLCKPKSES